MSLQKSENRVPVITKIEYQFINNVASITFGSDANHKNIQLNTEKAWLPVYITPGSATFTEKPKRSAAGKLFAQKLSFNYPGDNSQLRADLDSLDELPVIVKFTYSSGIAKIIGDLDIKAWFASSFKTSSSKTSDTYSFTCNARHRAFLIDSASTGGSPEDPESTGNDQTS